MYNKTEAWNAYYDKVFRVLAEGLEKRPVTTVHQAFDAGYDARNEEISHLRDLLRRALSSVEYNDPQVGNVHLCDEIQAELAKE